MPLRAFSVRISGYSTDDNDVLSIVIKLDSRVTPTMAK